MLLTISTTHRPATDLGYLLHKNPSNPQKFEFSFGFAHVFYPEATKTRCTAALLLEIDSIDIIRGRKRSMQLRFGLGNYVNDRPYAASSFMSVAIAKVFGTAMKGRSKERPELAKTPIPLEVKIASLRSEGGEELIRKIFEPLGYELEIDSSLLDDKFPEWGLGKYFTVTLKRACMLSDLLNHIYVLIPVLDNNKHYWVNDEEIEKLMLRGKPWLGSHPERELIVTRYLSYKYSLTRQAMAQLLEDDQGDPDIELEQQAKEEEIIEMSIGLHEQRLGTVLSILKNRNVSKVLDLGCGEGKLLQKLLDDNSFTNITGMDVSYRSLERAKRRLRIDRLPEMKRNRINLIHGSLMYRDNRLQGYDAAVLAEVIEHLDPARLSALEVSIFKYAKPSLVLVTTPNAEYNIHFSDLRGGKFRHSDHRFEWTRAEFQEWANTVAQAHKYSVSFIGIGPEDQHTGNPSQLAQFTKLA